jgi:hypothetical protein
VSDCNRHICFIIIKITTQYRSNIHNKEFMNPTQENNMNFEWGNKELIVVWNGSIDLVTLSSQDGDLIGRSWIPNSIVSLKRHWKFQFILFESNSHLTRIESFTFYKSSLQSILIPRNVEILGSKCFSSCK